jgi:uncharacterized protein YdbL (DUF1318 family)
MRNIIFKTIIIVSFVFSSVVFAIGLDEAKDNGLVGEKDNGYLGLVVIQNNTQNNTPSETQLLIDDINAKRKKRYYPAASRKASSCEGL